MKSVPLTILIALVKSLDALTRRVEDLLIRGHLLAPRVLKIRDQTEVQLLVLICQISDLQLVEQFVDRGLITNERRDNNDRASVGRNSLRKIDLRQQLGTKHVRQIPVDKTDCEFACRNQDQQRPKNGNSRAGVNLSQCQHETCDDQGNQQGERAEVTNGRMPLDGS